MLSSRSGVLAEAASTLIKTLSIVFFLKLYYTFITYDWRKVTGHEQIITSNEQKVTGNEQKLRATIKNYEQRAKN